MKRVALVLPHPTDRVAAVSSEVAESFASCLKDLWNTSIIQSVEPEHRAEFDLFFFFADLCYPDFAGLAHVSDKAYVVGTPHDRPVVEMVRAVAPLYHSLRGCLLLADEARALNQVYQTPTHIRQIIGGYALPCLSTSNPQPSVQEPPLLVSFDEISQAAQTELLVSTFIRTLDEYKLNAHLLLAGPNVGDYRVTQHPAVSVVVPPSKVEKARLLGNARATIHCNPSDSLSLTALDAWHAAVPLIVNARCNIMREHCERSGGGLYFYTSSVLQGCLGWAITHPPEARGLGQNGREYVAPYCDWSHVRRIMEQEIGK